MPPQGRLGDKANAPLDAHGCPACPHSVTGPAVAGSPNIHVNGRPALRQGDRGVHASCCGANTWQASAGSPTVFFNGKAAHRVGDATLHCGGRGQLAEGSSNVMVGGSSGGGGAGGSASGRSGGAAAGGSSGDANAGAGDDAHAETRAAMREAATSGKGLVKRDHASCRDGTATVTAASSAKDGS